MDATTYSDFRANMKSYFRKVNEDVEPLIVTNKNPDDNVVVIGKRDYDALMETIRIEQNPYLDKIVREGIAEIEAGDWSHIVRTHWDEDKQLFVAEPSAEYKVNRHDDEL